MLQTHTVMAFLREMLNINYVCVCHNSKPQMFKVVIKYRPIFIEKVYRFSCLLCKWSWSATEHVFNVQFLSLLTVFFWFFKWRHTLYWTTKMQCFVWLTSECWPEREMHIYSFLWTMTKKFALTSNINCNSLSSEVIM